MRAAVAVRGELVVETVDDPVPGKGQVLVAPRANGICGSDLEALAGTKERDPSGDGPLIPGHEFCAEVLDYGPGTPISVKKQWPAGSLVCANPFTGKGWALVGSSPGLPGGLAQLMVLGVDRLLPVPEGLAPERAALTEPLAVGIRAVAAARRGSSRGPYIVIGCGPIGLAVIAALRYEGLGPIIASDLAPARRALAARLGADVVVGADAESPFERLADFGFTEAPPSALLDDAGDGALGPVIFECVGKPGMLQGLLSAAPCHSHLVVVGVCRQPDTIVPVVATVREASVDFVLAYRPAEFAESLRRVAERAADVAPLITATVGLPGTPWAVEALRHGEHGKILVLPNATGAHQEVMLA
jgi:threonine dehydrogenase-like Zn-dependent dehydrogenase